MKQSRSAWIIVGLLGCLTLCLLTLIGVGGVYVLWGIDPSKSFAAATPTLQVFPTKVRTELPKDQSSCEAQGGKWGRIGPSPVESCNLRTSDGGQVCSDSSECEGLCIAELSPQDYERVRMSGGKVVIETKGKCAPWRITVGCNPVVTSGKVKGIMCID